MSFQDRDDSYGRKKKERRHDGSITAWRSKAVRGSQQISATQAEDLSWSAAQNHCVAMYLPQPLLEMQKLKASDVESLAEIVPGWGHQISRHFRWCQVIWLVPRDFNCSKSSSIGKRVQAWLAHRVPVRLSNSTSIVNEQSSCACKVGNLSDGALLRTASLTSWILCWQSFRARCLDGFIDIGRFNFRFSTSSSQSPFYLQAAESAFVTNFATCAFEKMTEPQELYAFVSTVTVWLHWTAQLFCGCEVEKQLKSWQHLMIAGLQPIHWKLHLV